MPNNQVLSGLMGVCVGDALGVPVEFTSQPPGTWSDDSSLTFCLAESLCNGFSLHTIAKSFWQWYHESYWTARGEVFDIGNTTFMAIVNWKQGASPIDAGGKTENSNGNGSLMRILPMAYLYRELEFSELIKRVHQVSCITHAHPRSQMACGIYISIAVALLKAVNLGFDTDITAAVTGGLAGIYYGFENIPNEWIELIARKDDIIDARKSIYRYSKL